MPWLLLEEYKKVFKQVKEILQDYEIKCLCGKKLYAKNLRHTESKSYDDAVSEYWIYAECKHCGYDYNYEKILRQWWNQTTIKRIQEEFK